MVILLEGADGAGKSTLYEKLKKSLNHKYEFINHLDRDKPGHRHWWKDKIDSDTVYVIDRGFLSEIIYRPIKLDKVPNISLYDLTDLCTDKLLILYCKTDRQLTDMLYRGDDYIDSAEHAFVTNAYDVVINILKLFTHSRVLHYDWTKDDYDLLINKLNFKEN